METIKSYLNNMFAGLPKNAQMDDLKNNMLANMEDKYNELKSQGKSENEAIGIVISEFGNIDELTNELGINKDSEENSQPLVTKNEVDAYINIKKTVGIQVGIGVMLCILSPAVLLFMNGLFSSGLIETPSYMPGVVCILVFVAAAVALFIYSGINFEPYKYMEEGVQVTASLQNELQKSYNSYLPTFNIILITSICLLIMSPIPIIVISYMNITSTTFGVVILLCIVAFAVFLLISSGTTKEAYARLLKLEDYQEKYSVENEKKGKIIGAIASIVWPLAVIIFLFCGFVYGLWYISWIIFPIVGIMFGVFCSLYSTLSKKE